MNTEHNSLALPRGALLHSFDGRHIHLLGALIVALILLYLAVGAFPIVPLENDGMRVSLGIQGIDLYDDYSYTYRYASQAGVYMIVGFLSRILELEPFHAFSFATFGFSVLFILLSSLFLSRVLNAKFTMCFLVIVSFQEVYVSGYYANSSIVAAAFLSAALLVATRGSRPIIVVASALLFSLAVWCRIDTVLMVFAFLALFYERGRRFLAVNLLFGFIVLGAIATLCYVSNVSMQLFVQQFSGAVGSPPDIRRTLTIYSTIFTFAAVYFSLFGLVELYTRKNWRLIFLSVVAPLPLVIAYGAELDSPKKVLYTLPLFAIPLISGVRWTLINRNNRVVFGFLIGGLLLAVGQYVFSPAYEIMFSRSIVVYTSDEARLRGAIAYTPIYYAKSRRAISATDDVFRKRLDEYLQQNNPSYIISQDWMTNQWLLYFLQGKDFRVNETQNFATPLEDGQRLILTRGSDTVYLLRWQPETALDLPPSLQAEILHFPSILYIGPGYTTTNYAQDSFLSERFEGHRLSDWGRFETMLFQQ